MAEKQTKKKPIRLEWQGSLASSASSFAGLQDAVPVEIRSKRSAAVESLPSEAWKGKLKVRREVKGRGGKPVCVLFDFTPLPSGTQIKDLCKQLKEKLACGGSVDNTELLVQVDDFLRVQRALESLGISAYAAGGFPASTS